ncbi:MAG TPA: DUF3108 domain-containing protein [Bradyrhizobium sp.]|nr:DUF3108 domain-containing protein [Bradyrhizobium sp.]
MLALLAPQHRAAAQGRVDARYEATLAGIPVGAGSWTVEVQDDQFSAAASGGTAGLLKAFSAASGTSASQGRVVNGALVPTAYNGTTNMWKKSEAIHMTLVNGYVKEFSIDPQPPVDPDRIPVTDAQRHGVFDPMTGALLHVSGNGELLSPDACHNSAAFFDGRMRYELHLDYKRMTTVKSRVGYHGPAVVCAVYFVPVSGYIPDRPVIKYLAAQRNMEVTFVPLVGTRILVPYRMVVPTPLGTAMLEATQFITQATPPRVAKTQ